jgi:hypothetical protein
MKVVVSFWLWLLKESISSQHLNSSNYYVMV